MKYSYNTTGTCSRKIDFEIDGGVVKNVTFEAGCNGNLKLISKLVDGLTPEELIERCKGITCGYRDTSCGDQLARAVGKAIES
ncbi:MAG: TIGR03905 family TSCPD domain-containing protein [Clostridiales bacterium]|jgi:uncharacterized protein (TIGR03905 family)|nr:TIGR03905 family TSCPD domain-containing protein [Clostridiales bacterium]